MATVNSVDVNGTSYDIEDTEARNGVSALKTENKTTKDNISDTDQIMIRDTTEKKDKLIDYDKLADAILTKITSKQFTLDQGSKTLVQALNELNSNPKAQFGTTADIEVATNSIQTIDVTFEKAFKSVPTVLCSIRSGTTNPVYGSVNAFVDYSSVTKTGFTIKIANSATSSAVLRPAVSWIAIA